jgi:prepilin-type processing-associated H-X9-DG protein/prepilin-type N-terminal cleavage/methylation domain-containing protein
MRTSDRMCRRLRGAFTLIELLVVIAILAALAAILMPVLASARLSSYRAVCDSNLRQFGLAFRAYADDWSGRLPMPGGVEPGSRCWAHDEVGLSETGAITHKEVGALWRYVRVRMESGDRNNLWSCPFAVRADDSGDGSFRPGQNYVMNEYLRAGHSGCFPYDRSYPGHDLGFPSGACPRPGKLILLFEAVQDEKGLCARHGSPFYVKDVNIRPNANRAFKSLLYANIAQNYHGGKSNFLFLDGHVSLLAPDETLSKSTVEAYRGKGDFRYWGSIYPGHGSGDLWDPRISEVKFP